jgi:hypothetical protein
MTHIQAMTNLITHAATDDTVDSLETMFYVVRDLYPNRQDLRDMFMKQVYEAIIAHPAH